MSKRLSAPERREVIERGAVEAFAERGYAGASIDEIARRAGVSAPVIYDHFDSKRELHRRLLERTRDELLAMWVGALESDEPGEARVAAAFDAWARYVEANPYASRMFFRETTGEAEVQAIHRRVQAEGLAGLGRILAGLPEAAAFAEAAGDDPLTFQMAAEVMRSGLTGLAVWWNEHPEVPRERIVATAMNVLWLGLARVSRGEVWQPGG